MSQWIAPFIRGIGFDRRGDRVLGYVFGFVEDVPVATMGTRRESVLCSLAALKIKIVSHPQTERTLDQRIPEERKQSHRMKSNSESPYSDDLVSQFVAFTSADTDRAIAYLEMSGGDLETAVGLFLEHQNSSPHDTVPNRSHSSHTNTNRSKNRSTSNEWVDADGVRAPDQARRMRLLDFEDDPEEDDGMPADRIGEMLMRSHASMMQSHFPAEFLSHTFTNDARNFPGARTTPFDVRDAVNRAAAMAATVPSSSNAPRRSNNTSTSRSSRDYEYDSLHAYNDNDDDDDDVQIVDYHEHDSDDEVQEVTNPTSTVAPQRLSDMFSPPLTLIYMGPGGFQGARGAAKDSNRWLLVNLQRDSDFACHALNRDVWRDELVDNLIREGFVFWQSFDTSPEGQIYIERYKVTAYPHVAIIDPRTGRLMWKKEGWTQMNPMTAAAFSELAADFCSRHTFDQPPTAPSIHGSSFGGTNRVGKRPVHEMTEEEQLEAVLRVSRNEAEDEDMTMIQTAMTENEGRERIAPDLDQPVSLKDDSKEGNNNVISSTVSCETDISRMDVGEEPTGNEGVARIMFRMPDGKRLVRKFYPEDHVKKVYGYVAQSIDDAAKGKPFELKAGFPPKDLISLMDDTIENARLSGDTVTVRWKIL